MKKENLIRLGIDAQKRFDIAGDYKIYFEPPDSLKRIVFPVHDHRAFMGYGVDEVHLETWASTDGNEVADVGYAPRAKILVVKFRDGKK